MLTSEQHKTLVESIVKTLVYYDLFRYPLKSSEVFRFLRTNSVNETDVATCLNKLTAENMICRFGEFYTLQKDAADIKRRMDGNKEAQRLLPVAMKQATLIARFPFVRAVFASGSFSKGYMYDQSDLDFFVITSPGRLWICRAMLAFYKRIVLSNSHKYFCTNYFIDLEHLDIEEKNVFTATELATLIPLYGHQHYSDLMRTNRRWLYETFPNFVPGATEEQQEKLGVLKRSLEILITFAGGKFWDRIIMRLAERRWTKRYGKAYSSTDFQIAFKTKPHVSKNHPRNFQRRVMEAYEQRESFYFQKLNLR